jgi:uncharacterized protein (TIGR04255 family)
VTEVVLGVQFGLLKDFHNAHAGLLWGTTLKRKYWPKVRAAPIIRSSFERFGEHEQWGPVLPFEIRRGIEPDRTQFLNEAEDLMIQVQNTRFHYNWIKKDGGEYPSYDKLLPEFQNQWEGFRAFAVEADLGEVEPNQWEVTYVNHIQAGSLWRPAKEWTSLLPWLRPPASGLLAFDSVAGTWDLVIGEEKGRLHVKISRARRESGDDILVLDLTARGPLEAGGALEDGLSLGHDAIVSSFVEMTSEEAHREWGRYR